ncbi:NAD(P)H-binding protein [Aeromicrobium chenweiae]|uniref:NAD(P)H-binding protein n=1 Tax=Aeromicrobium chenweiae TaxID=2079793 RepID=UPI001901F74E|nr:NAD(P)H-binding protein [Aeromicrobium chenweiae]
MSKILVTGASGNLGRKTLRHLLKRRPATDLVGLARDPAKAADLAAEGIEIRTGDYFGYESLVRAFGDIEKVMLVSTHALTDRNRQHYNVITAARQAGVKHIVFNPVIRKEGSAFRLAGVTADDIFVEQTLMASGLTYTLLGNPPFLESLPFYIGEKAYESGVRVPGGDGKVAPASRDDLAEAGAVVLTDPGHENRTYSLHGDPAVSFADIAHILSDIRGVPVPYIAVSEEEHISNHVAAGLLNRPRDSRSRGCAASSRGNGPIRPATSRSSSATSPRRPPSSSATTIPPTACDPPSLRTPWAHRNCSNTRSGALSQRLPARPGTRDRSRPARWRRRRSDPLHEASAGPQPTA